MTANAAGSGVGVVGTGAAPLQLRAIVIGTGFGGAVTACRLAQAGFDVELLERGRRYGLADFPVLPKDGEIMPDARRWTWAGSQGLWDLRNLEGVVVAQAAGYGGGSLVYANVHLRPPVDVFNDDAWPDDCRGRIGLERFFDLVGYTLDVKPVPDAWRTAGKTHVMAEAFRRATRPENVFFPPLAIRFPPEPTADRPEPPRPTAEDQLPLNDHGKPQGECQRCGACDFGCGYGAKNTLDRNYLAKAERTEKVNVHTLTEVEWVERAATGYYCVHYKDHLTGAKGTLEAPYVFLCAGSVNTTELLLRSVREGLPNPITPTSGVAETGQRYFFNADAPAMVFDTKVETMPSAGPVITTALIYHDHDDRCSRREHKDAPRRPWFLIEDGGYPAGVENLFSLFRNPLLLGRNRFDPAAMPDTVTAIGGPADPMRPDRYPAFLGGLLAALRDEMLPDLLPQKFKIALDQLLGAAGHLRDNEIAELAEAIRDEVLFRSAIFRALHFLRVHRWARWLWKATYRLFVRAGALDRKRLLETTLAITHHRYGVDDWKPFPPPKAVIPPPARALKVPRALLTTFPYRVGRALMGERYPVNGPGEDRFGRPLPKPPEPDRSRRALLLAMGRDDLPATLKLQDDRVMAEFSDAAFQTLSEEERVMRGIAKALGGTLRASPLWALARRPMSSHSHGGCTLNKVTDKWGEVRNNPNLFINDGALLPRPVGVNPSGTIAAVAERNIEHFVLGTLGVQQPPWQKEIEDARAWAQACTDQGIALAPPVPERIHLENDPIGFSFTEAMGGYLDPVDDLDEGSDKSQFPGALKDSVPLARFLVPEQAARGGPETRFVLTARVLDIGAFLNDEKHRIDLRGKMWLPLPKGSKQAVQVDITTGFLDLFADAGPGRRIMKYELGFEWDKRYWRLKGRKEIEDNAGFDAWLDTSVLYSELYELTDPKDPGTKVVARGVLRLGIKDFLENQIKGLVAEGTDDPARVIWTLGSFAVFFFGDLQNIYAPEIKRFQALFGSGWRAVPVATKKNTPPTGRLLRGL